MHKVESNYKDPDRYIASLKTKLRLTEETVECLSSDNEDQGEKLQRLINSAYGPYYHGWINKQDIGMSSMSKGAVDRMKVGAPVWIEGRIIEIKTSIKKADSVVKLEYTGFYHGKEK